MAKNHIEACWLVTIESAQRYDGSICPSTWDRWQYGATFCDLYTYYSGTEYFVNIRNNTVCCVFIAPPDSIFQS